MKVEGILAAIKTTVGGLNTQVRKLECISDNIANAEKTPDKSGEVYKRKVLFSEVKKNHRPKHFSDELGMKLKETNENHLQPGTTKELFKDNQDALKVVEQKGEITVYEPNNPMADEKGYVRKPDINLVEEMVDMISTTRIYEANVTVMNAAKNIAKKSMEI